MSLTRRTPMNRGGRLTRGRAMKRGKALAQKGQRAKREEAERTHFRRVVKRRAHGCCEREECGSTWKVQAHHILPLGRGGSNDPANGAALCSECHDAVHRHAVPDWRMWLLLKKPAYVTPADLADQELEEWAA